MKIALVHDYLKELGGAERVLLALHEIWPEAPIYTIYYKKGSSVEKVFGPAFTEASTDAKAVADKSAGKGVRVVQSWFGRISFCDKLISPLRFLLPLIWKSFDFSDYDLVISSASWAITKGFGTGGAKSITGTTSITGGECKIRKTVEICYCHTPPRYLYGYETSKDWKKNPFVRFYATIVNHFLRMYDFQQAQKATYFIANSREVAERIKKFYRRESTVINPPVDLPKFIIHNSKFNYFLTGGRLEKAKNFDLIIKACNELKVTLKIYGAGTQEKYLRSISGTTVEFLGRISDEEKFELMAGSKAFIVAATDEDFGITPVEAMAVGTPVIAYRGGGYLETVVEGKTGVFFDEATVEGVVGGIWYFREIGEKIRPEDCRKQAEKFSKERFKKEIINFVNNIK